MSRVRCILIAALVLFPLVVRPAWSSTTVAEIDSLVPLLDLATVDPGADLQLTPHAMTIDPLGRPWILDRARGRVLLLGSPDRAARSMSVADARISGAFPFADMAASGSYLFLLEPASPSLVLLDLDGYVRERVDLGPEIELEGDAGFSAGRLLVGRSGDLWLIDPRGSVLHFDRRGRFLDAPLDGLAGRDRPTRIADAALSRDDGVVLLDPGLPSLVLLPAAGERQPALLLGGRLEEPAALAVDDDGTCFLLEGSGRIRAIAPTGAVLYDGIPRREKEVALGRACIAPDGTLMRADPARGSLSRWRIFRTPSGDEER
jgi:hypothetical protein